ncbi:phage tail protein [Aggregatibacter aphrophilus]|nr:phage tail protein [Aggregatibacter aphrophilus]
MASLITPQFEQYIAQQTINKGTVVFDEFIFANIPGLTAENLKNHLTMPQAEHIVHRQAVSQSGVINENAVVYSVTIGTEIGDFDFNFIGLVNKSKNMLAVAVQTNPVKKTRNKNNVQGNSITRNVLLEFSGAKALTNINVAAQTWQIDFTVRLHGIDEKIRLTNRDLYGRAVFFDDSFLVKRKSGNDYTIEPGVAYVEGVRANMTALENINAANLPCSIYLDVVHHCTVTGAYETEIKFLKANKEDYTDTTNRPHYVQILADIDKNGVVTDRRLLSPFLGINPLDLDDTTLNKADKHGHTHRLPLASLFKRGIVKLYSGYDSDAEDLAATPKAIKTLKAFIDAITRNLGNYIPNSKKSSRVDSNSADDVATSAAVKKAYDKAESKWTAQPATETTAGILPISHKSDGTDKNKFASEFAVGEAAKKGLPVGAIVAFPTAVTNPNGFLRANGSTFNASAFPDLFKVLGNSNTLPDLTRSDVGMTAYFATDNIPAGWIAFDDIAAKVSAQTYPELYRHLIAKYGSISAVPKAADRFLRNAGNGLQVGQTQDDELKRHAHKLPLNNAYTKDTLKNYNGNTEYTDFGVPKTILMTLVGDSVVADNYYAMPTDDDAKTGGNETRPKSLVLKLCIKARNSFDDVVFWIKSHGDVVNIGALDAGRLAQGLQEKADLNHQHTTSQITDFNESTNAVINAAFTYQKIGEFEVRKYPDGTMIQTCRFTPPNNRVGAQDKKFTFNWAVAFVEKPKVWIQHNNHEKNGYGSLDMVMNTVEQECSNSKVTFWAWEWYYNNHLISFDFFAIGRWK